MPTEHLNLAEQALANLVNQFARPLDFLRELAQNSIDAGSPRIEVAVAWDPPKTDDATGVLRVHVDDFGEGMDESIIDDQLTRLFSSTKEDDLTKIGKFGIGFTSIFAIQPEAVLLRTGRHGEYWELLFHADRSFDKVKITEPVTGTQITLFKRMSEPDVERFIEECRFILTYWCEHSDIPITFHDRTQQEVVATPENADPFAAFEDPTSPLSSGPETINRPLELVDTRLAIHHQEAHTEIVIGEQMQPRYGYYNGGLTLLSTTNVDALGEYVDNVRHLSFKIKNDHLEHTLTRDNVLQDENWHAVMAILGDAHTRLREALLDRVESAVASGENLKTWHGWLAAECQTSDSSAFIEKMRERKVFADWRGRPISLSEIRGKGDSILLSTGHSPLYEELDRIGVLQLADLTETRELLEASETAPVLLYLWEHGRVERTEDVWVMPAVVSDSELDPLERSLIRRTGEIIRAGLGLTLRIPKTSKALNYTPSEEALLNRITLRVGDFGGIDLGREEVLCLNGPRDSQVFRRPGVRWYQRLPAFLQWRTLLINRNHSLFRAQLLASTESVDLAAFGLAQALLHTEGIEGERAFARMLQAMSEPTERDA
jgi:hypothetical protein